MIRSEPRSIVFFVPADATKSKVVLQSLLSNEYFVENYEPRAIVDAPDGKVVELLTRRGVPYVVADGPGNPRVDVERLTADFEGFAYLVSCGWTKLIPPEVLDMPDEEAINCHGSYLPDYKGPAIHRVQWANAERTGGATIHVLDEKFDSGRILCRERFRITIRDTPMDILVKSAESTAVMLREALLLLETGYEGIENEGGRYFTLLDWRSVLLYGVVNHLLWLIGTGQRWPISE